MKNYQKLILSILLPLALGMLGSVFTSSSLSDWYANLVKPDFSPSNWLFAPAWTALYILMGLSFYYIWKMGYSRKTKLAFHIYFIQLFLNLLWSFLFFGLRNPLLGLVEIVMLWFVIAANILLFYGLNKNSAYLLVPYILWVSFASVLNYYMFILNA